MDKIKFITDLSLLGHQLNEIIDCKLENEHLVKAELENKWFTQKSIKYTLIQFSQLLKKDNLNKWLSDYEISINNKPKQ